MSARSGMPSRGGDGGGDGEVPPSRGMALEEDDEDLPLELEHMLGFTGARRGTLVAHPRMPDVFIKAVSWCALDT